MSSRLQGATDPPVIQPLTVKVVTEGFVRCKFPTSCNQAACPSVERLLKLILDLLAQGDVGSKRHDKVSVINKTEAHWMQLPSRDCRGEDNAMAGQAVMLRRMVLPSAARDGPRPLP